MANEEQLSILKQGVGAWNKWRKENAEAKIDLSNAYLLSASLREANLRKADLTKANLSDATLDRASLSKANCGGAYCYGAGLFATELSGAFLFGAILSAADLREANLTGADLRKADLSRANLRIADLMRADLRKAYLSRADFREADLREADLGGADLRGANLERANLSEGNLIGSNFLNAKVAGTNFGHLDLSETVGLEGVVHSSPSRISRDTFAFSNGKIPEAFLRGCGLSDWEIQAAKLYALNLTSEEINKILYKMYDLRAGQAIQISPLFISYSHADVTFVERLEVHLNKKSIRFWRDIHDMKSGRMEKQIDRAIRQNPTVLLVLSENSLNSDWVEHEVRTARELEKETGRDVLCPVALDDSWKSSRWPKRVMEQIMEYNILDFSTWEDDSKFDRMFRKLMDGLELFYKG